MSDDGKIEVEDATPRALVAAQLRDMADRVESGALLNFAMTWNGIDRFPDCVGYMNLKLAYERVFTEGEEDEHEDCDHE